MPAIWPSRGGDEAPRPLFLCSGGGCRVPLTHDVDQNRLLVALGSGAISAFFHWASAQSSDRKVSVRVMRGEMIGSSAMGVLTTQLLAWQTLYAAGPLDAFIAAAVVGFTYGPKGLIIATRAGAKKLGFDPPPEPPPVQVIAEKQEKPEVVEVAQGEIK